MGGGDRVYYLSTRLNIMTRGRFSMKFTFFARGRFISRGGVII